MKVLVTHELFISDCHGGGEIVVFDVTKKLKEAGIEVEVLTTGNPNIKQFDDIKTIRLPVHRYLMNLAAPWIYKYAKKFDLIQTNNYNACLPSFLAGKWSHKPVVCLIHGMYTSNWLSMRGPVLGRISKWMEKIQVCHDFDRIIFLSNHAKKEGIKIGVPEDRIEVIKPGIPRGYKKYKMKDKEQFVLFVGRLAKQKGLDYLLSAAKELPDIKFVLVGRGEQENRLKSIAPNNVKFLGYLPEEEIIDLYSRALVFCLPSVDEGFGLVLIEAMASGCAIVSTIPLDYEGIKTDVGNTEQLKNGIKYLINNPDIALEMGKKNREEAKNYSWDTFIKKLIKTYEEILAQA